ncbi:hypothetical protein [Salibacterium halotolerans]|uniref:ABC transporter periplasmic binding protein yphF n=1 Tax=Salibacterium halotolerans TaxID=1884432 RepID=A0A1I5Q511_9BACI|nr:hypothetical protein [Salibacterium halotolerans]SFP41269.1 hypothetical protein SAMN05518683_10529 [Salibacterium halotolerans]
MKRYISLLGGMAAMVILLSGCLFPQNQRAENQTPYESQLRSVQQAVEQYQKDTGVLPIRTVEADTPVYQKYQISFNELIPRYMQQPPGNSFENGGSYRYVIITPEEDPTVKVIDLSIMDEVQKLARAVNSYIDSNEYAPIKESAGPGVFEIDNERLGYSGKMQVDSPYHDDTSLPMLINAQGEVRIDYAIDLNIALEEYEHDLHPGDDIRSILAQNSPIVPAYSVPYTLNESGEPVFKESS